MNIYHNFYFPVTILFFLLLLILFFELNASLFLILNHGAQFIPITWWGYITYIGDGMIAGCILAIIFRKKPQIALIGIITVLISGIIVIVLKDLFSIPRPASVINQDQFFIFGDILLSRAFPSGHSSTAFSLFGALIYNHHYNNKGGLFLLIALLIAFSRIAIGVHWPTDILAGSMIGITTAYLFSIRLKNFMPGKKLELAIGIFLILICISTLLYNPGLPNIQLLQWGFGLGGIICIVAKFYSKYKII